MFRCLCLLLGVLIGMCSLSCLEAAGGSRKAKEWTDIPAEELSLETPRVDPFASAEFTFRSVEVDDSGPETRYVYHNRVRLFTEDGVRAWSKIDIEYASDWIVSGIRARILYPDGGVAYLGRHDVYQRETYRDGSRQFFVKSFSFPQLRVGCVIEYLWEVIRPYPIRGFDVLVRDEWPTWVYELSIRPNQIRESRCTGYHLRLPVERVGGRYWYRDSDLLNRATESFMDARRNFEPFVYLEYASERSMLDPDNYWAYRGGLVVEKNRGVTDGIDEGVVELAEHLYQGVETTVEKLVAAYKFCTDKIENISFYSDQYSVDELGALTPNEGPGDTVLNGYGTRYDINVLFASLAQLAECSAGLAEVENCLDFVYDPSAHGAFNISDWVVAIEMDNRWRFFDPGSAGLPFEVLNAENSDVHALTSSGDFFTIVKTPRVDDEFTKIDRFASLRLDVEGGVEGVVKVIYSGYAWLWRERYFSAMTLNEKESFVRRQDWGNRFTQVEVSEFEVREGSGVEGEFVMSYRISIPNYADCVGDRIFVNPSVFEAEKKGLFSGLERQSDVVFDYTINVRDRVTIQLPEGLSLGGAFPVLLEFDGEFLKRASRTEFNFVSGSIQFQCFSSLTETRVERGEFDYLKGEFDAVSGFDSQLVGLAKSK